MEQKIFSLLNFTFDGKITHDLGGVMLRLQDTLDYLREYLDGTVPAIEELETQTISGINKTWRSSASYMSRFCY